MSISSAPLFNCASCLPLESLPCAGSALSGPPLSQGASLPPHSSSHPLSPNFQKVLSLPLQTDEVALPVTTLTPVWCELWVFLSPYFV